MWEFRDLLISLGYDVFVYLFNYYNDYSVICSKSVGSIDLLLVFFVANFFKEKVEYIYFLSTMPIYGDFWFYWRSFDNSLD